MPKNVGRYDQGDIKTMAPEGYEYGGSKVPNRAGPAGPVPKNKVMPFENDKTVGNNDGHKAH